MKKNYFFKTLTVILFFTLTSFCTESFSQTILNKGDIAFTRIQMDDETFSFVILVPLESGTEFYITDEAWNGISLRNFESELKFTATSSISAGEEISYNSALNTLTFSGGSTLGTVTSVGTADPTSGNMLGSAGDNLFIHQGAQGVPIVSQFITGISANSGTFGSAGNAWQTTTTTSSTLLPSSLTNGTDAIGLFPSGGTQSEVDNARYKASATHSGDKAIVLAAIMDVNNWEFDNSTPFGIPSATFSISSSNTAPLIGGTTSGQSVNDNATISPFSAITTTDADGDNLSATITLDNNAKGVLTGTGLTGTGPYTIASTTPTDLQAKLRALSFNPTDNRTSTTETTTFTVVVNDGTVDDTDNTTTVISSAVAPAVSSVGVPANATYVSGQNLDFTVNFNENVTVNTIGGTPQMVITIGSTVRQAVYQSGSGTSALLFRYTVQTGELDTDGIAVGTLAANGGTLKDSGGTDADLTLNSVGATAAVLVDGVVPTVSSVSVPSNATYVSGQNLDFTVNFNENVTVNTTGGTPQIAITIGSTVRQAVYQSGSGTSALLFRYTVQTGELDTDGIAVGTLAANGGTLKDAAGNDADLTLNSVGSTTAVLVDALTTATLTTADAGSVDSTTVTLGGETTADGGASITERGVVYAITGTNNNPTIGGTGVTKEDNGSGIGVFSEPITGLTANTQYSYAAYAINSKGTSYGTVKTFTTASLGVEQDILQKSISVYPNPVVNALRVDAGRAIEVENIEVYDISGKLLKTLKQTNKTIDFSSMHSGSYFVKINTNQGSLTKLIIKK